MLWMGLLPEIRSGAVVHIRIHPDYAERDHPLHRGLCGPAQRCDRCRGAVHTDHDAAVSITRHDNLHESRLTDISTLPHAEPDDRGSNVTRSRDLRRPATALTHRFGAVPIREE
jgi:hypothetical protein